ncbi:hypothetical protein FEM03_11845 [Phragmitibacter flavus]|uniref:CopG family transcriptional regulator n=1 Tax=Phragmitibacter flavus TaxID=2576071 RepID=A0A5R8KDN3_9BACT|nr:hypothetical protein [Phragmitibacter flavus]TLD70418.1 hypothetical protein FEM03_11845 [Phragmitibacter flavus]
MARPKNSVETESMTIAFTPQLKHYLEVLAMEGFYGGGTPQDVVRYLVNNAVQQLVKDKLLQPVQWRSLGEGKVEIVDSSPQPDTAE